MKLDGLKDTREYLQSLVGENGKVESVGGGELVAYRLTKTSVQQVEIARREAQQKAKQMRQTIEVDLPDYEYEEVYRAEPEHTERSTYFRIKVKRGMNWVNLH